jgi:hypothetical protein
MSGSGKLMNSLTYGGRYMVAPLVAGAGLWSLIMLVEEIPIARLSWAAQTHAAPGEVPVFFLDIKLIAWIALFPSAWGILKWQSWGYLLTFAMCILAFFQSTAHIALFGFHLWSSLLTLTSAAAISWLLLPGVRTQFWSKAAAQ